MDPEGDYKFWNQKLKAPKNLNIILKFPTSHSHLYEKHNSMMEFS